jgi:hypothetical protein
MSEKVLLSFPLYKEKRDQFNVWLKEFVQNSNWLNDNLTELRSKYPDMYVAVRNKKVVKTGKTLARIRQELRDEFGAVEGTAIEYVSSKPLKFLF